jgi:hypothetical protein
MMRELAEASQPIDDNLEAALRKPTILERVNDVLEDLPDASKILSRGGPFVIAALVIILVLVSGPTYTEQPNPVQFTGTPRPLEIYVRQPISDVFGALGEQNFEPVPGYPNVRRYRYGSNLLIEAISGYVYSVDLGLVNRSWRGLRVGMSETEAAGALALLAEPVAGGENPAPPRIRAGRQVYPTASSRPIRTLRSEVRPRAGCYDVIVELRPQQTGLLLDGDERYSVVGNENQPLQYVVTRILVQDRSRGGTKGDAVC